MEDDSKTIFHDDFSTYPPGELLNRDYFKKMLGTVADAGQRPRAVAAENRLGPWELTTLHYSWHSQRIPSYRECCLPWRIVDRNGTHWLDQPESFFNVVFKAGSPLWRDYTLECRLAVGATGSAGPIVRYHTSRRNYWICFESGQPVRIIRRDQDDHVVLAVMTGSEVTADTEYTCRVSCHGDTLSVVTELGEVRVADDAYRGGQIALRTEGPSRFTAVKVTASDYEEMAWERRQSEDSARTAARKKNYPRPQLIHTVPIPQSTGSIHLRDVNNDGRPELVVCDLEVPELDYIRLAGISVIDWEGELLWQLGEKRESKYAVHGAFAFNVADIDGDGRAELLVTRDFEILIIDGATGRIKHRAPTPVAFAGQEDHFPHTVGDSFLVCNLRGLDSPQDFVLKDRYRNLWAYTSDLRPLWHRHLNTGHYPRAFDINDDGRDEIMAGYSMLAADGSTMWTVPGGNPLYNRFPGPEHMDAVLLGRFREPAGGGPVEIAMAASDLGFVLMDAEGNIKAQHYVGHAQSLGAGRFRPDLPGRQFIVRTAWGNQGIMNLFDQDGRLLLIREPEVGGFTPVNWTGDGRALLRFSTGLADGDFRQVVDLPAGGGVSPWAWDINGDGVDEIFIRTSTAVEVYGPDRVPARPEPVWPQTLTNWNDYGGFIR